MGSVFFLEFSNKSRCRVFRAKRSPPASISADTLECCVCAETEETRQERKQGPEETK